MSEMFGDARVVLCMDRSTNVEVREHLCVMENPHPTVPETRNAKGCFRNSLQNGYALRYKAVCRVSPLLNERICMLCDSVSNMPQDDPISLP